MTSAVGGILLALGASVPVSLHVTTISFTIHVLCRIGGAVRGRRGWTRRAAPSPTAALISSTVVLD